MASARPPTSALADVLTLHGRQGVLSPPLHHAAGRLAAIVGTARTVAFTPTPDGDGGSFEELYALLDEDLTGHVLVAAGAQEVVGAIWGEILTRAAERAGLIAVLIAGAIRDVAQLRGSSTSIWALSEHTAGATGQARIAQVDQPVRIGAVEIAVGDTLAIDGGGVVRLPAAQSSDLLAQATLYAAAELRVLDDLATGIALTAAYEHKRAVRRLLEDR